MVEKANPSETFYVQPYWATPNKSKRSFAFARFFEDQQKTKTIQMKGAELLHVPTVSAVEGLVATTTGSLVERIESIDGKVETFAKDMVRVVAGISDRAPTRAEYDELKATVEAQAERIAQLEAQMALVLKQLGGSDVSS